VAAAGSQADSGRPAHLASAPDDLAGCRMANNGVLHMNDIFFLEFKVLTCYMRLGNSQAKKEKAIGEAAPAKSTSANSAHRRNGNSAERCWVSSASRTCEYV
jgi:hypothetical protein